jgi:uncharacterized repeat protein (TIGR03803 family)
MSGGYPTTLTYPLGRPDRTVQRELSPSEGQLVRISLAVVITALAVTAATACSAGTFGYLVLHNFDSSGGEPRNVGIDANGNVIGFTAFGGLTGNGSVFSIAPGGQISTIYNFAGGDDGGIPNYLELAPNGPLYVATKGTAGCGTLDKITLGGMEQTLLQFSGSNGCTPNSMTLCTKAILCGTTQRGGTADGGIVYTIKPGSPHPKETIIADFDGAIGDGCDLLGGGLVRGLDGTLYGTTESGGADGHGCLFMLTPDGNITTLHNFDSSNGDNPIGHLGYDYVTGKLSGSTFSGGAFGYGTVWSYDLSTNTWTVKAAFGGYGPMGQARRPTSGVPGANPNGGVIADRKGNIFGTTVYGGGGAACAQGCGEVFEITSKGKFKVLHAFNGTDGEYPVAAPALDKSGNLYGTTLLGGTGGFGVVYKITR